MNSLNEQIPKEVKGSHRDALMALQQTITWKKQAEIGRVVDVLREQ